MLWLLVSYQLAVYCICCTPPHHHGVGGAGATGLVVHGGGSATDTTVVTTGAAGSPALADGAELDPEEGGAEGDGRPAGVAEGATTIEELWVRATAGCQRDSFDLVFSLLAVGLAVAAFSTEQRNYYAALLFRALTGVVLFLLVVILVIAPSQCARANVHYVVSLLARITLYHTLWWLTQFRRLVERVLAQEYGGALTLMTPDLLERQGGKKLRHLLTQAGAGADETTPRALFDRVEGVGEFLGRQPLTPQQAAHANQTSTPVSRREALSGIEPTVVVVAEEDETSVMTRTLYKLTAVAGAHRHVFEWMLSWKNRHFSAQQLLLIDLAQTLWVLLVCPGWLWLALIQYGVLFWCIYSACRELLQSHARAKLLTVYASLRDGTAHISVQLS
jgi:hypothetical protein